MILKTVNIISEASVYSLQRSFLASILSGGYMAAKTFLDLNRATPKKIKLLIFLFF